MLAANWPYIGMGLSFIGGLVSFFANIVTIVAVSRARRKREKMKREKMRKAEGTDWAKADQANVGDEPVSTPPQQDAPKYPRQRIRPPTEDELKSLHDYHMYWRSQKEQYAASSTRSYEYRAPMSAYSASRSRPKPKWRRTRVWAIAFFIFLIAAVFLG